MLVPSNVLAISHSIAFWCFAASFSAAVKGFMASFDLLNSLAAALLLAALNPEVSAKSPRPLSTVFLPESEVVSGKVASQLKLEAAASILGAATKQLIRKNPGLCRQSLWLRRLPSVPASEQRLGNWVP